MSDLLRPRRRRTVDLDDLDELRERVEKARWQANVQVAFLLTDLLEAVEDLLRAGDC